MVIMAIEKVPSAKNVALQKLLERSGITLDKRQDNRTLKFAMFPIYDFGNEFGLSKLSISLKDYFIAETSVMEFGSKVKQITFSPVLSELGPPFEGVKLSYLRSEDAIHIKFGLVVKEWISANTKKRRRLLVNALIEALQAIKPSWLTSEDKEALIILFRDFSK
jgi:hypothetical protein